ncbi:MAG: hypothetical protein AB1806_09645 [Acidobacteriota bacterium]
MMHKGSPLAFTLAILLVAATVACIEVKHDGPTSPSGAFGSLTAGLWTSQGTIDPNACGNFQWQITELTSDSAKGTFSATCAGGITLSGNAEGKLNGTTLNWQATGTAGTPIGNCPFSLSGTANLEGNGVRVNYSGNTCVGPVAGSELLTKK